ncbi:MAG: VWA domain-containing protein [Bacteroidales bacterium]
MRTTLRPAVIILAAVLLVAGVSAQSAPPAAPQGAAQNPPAAQAQNPPQNPQQPTFRTGINFVRVDVLISDKQGNPVTDLKRDDFEVLEDNKPQKLETFKLVDFGSVAQQQLRAANEPLPREIRSDEDQELEASREDVRIFAIFLDDYHTRLGSSMAVRAPLAKFMETQLGPNDLVAIMYPLTPISDVILTRDHDAIARAIQHFEGRKYDYRPRNTIEEQYQNYPAQTVEQIRNQVSLSALKALVMHLGSLREGRKAVIVVSEGYTNILPPQLRDPVASMPGLANPNRYNPNAGENNPREDTNNFFMTADMQNDLRNVFDAANRNNTSLYTLDPRGLATSEFDVSQPAINQSTDREILNATQDTLHVLAVNTDGRAIVNRNDISGGLRQVVRDSSSYYLLGYTSATPADGKFHEIKVKVKRPGTQVRARKGYWAATPDERARALAPPTPDPPAALTKALSNISASHGRAIRTWIGTTRGENGRTRVTFVWEPVPSQPGEPVSDTPTRVALTVVGADGRPYFRGDVPDGSPSSAPPSTGSVATAGAAAPATASMGTGARAVFEVPPGKLQLKMSVQGTRSQVIDVDTREIDVPDLTGPQVRVTTPAVFAARNAREFRTLSTDANAVPTADRVFSRTERLLIRFDAFGPGYTVPTVTAKLLSRGGQEMTTVPAQQGEKYPEEHSIDLPLAGLAAGEYVIQITAKGPAGDATEMVAIRIVS